MERITNHADQALDRLILQYRNKPNIEKMIRSLCGEVQRLEDAIYDVFTKRFLDTAEGAQLDGLGVILKLARGSFDDTTYRTWLKSKILAIRSSGNAEELIAIFKRLANNGVEFHEYQPAAAVLRVLGALGATKDQIVSILGTAKAGGVNLQVVTTDSPDNDTLKFWSDNFVEHTNQLDGGHAIGSATLFVLEDMAAWPASGCLGIDVGGAHEEWLRYTSRTDYKVNLASPTKYTHDHLEGVTLAYEMGLGDDSLTNGGVFASADEAR